MFPLNECIHCILVFLLLFMIPMSKLTLLFHNLLKKIIIIITAWNITIQYRFLYDISTFVYNLQHMKMQQDDKADEYNLNKIS